MKDIKVEKLVLNIGCGTKTKIEDAKAILDTVSGKKSVITISKKRSTFNFPKGKPIGCKITIRNNADEMLKRFLEANENIIKKRSFDSTGNVSFGVKEYIDIPGMDYNPKIGMLGFDVCVTLERPGYRVKRKMLSKKIGKKHVITKEDAIEFMKNKFSVRVEE